MKGKSTTNSTVDDNALRIEIGMYHPCRRMQEHQSFAELQDSLLDLEAHQKVLCSTD
jgi:hypothetical protein